MTKYGLILYSALEDEIKTNYKDTKAYLKPRKKNIFNDVSTF